VGLVSGFQELLQGLSPVTTAPSFVSLCTIVSGWLFPGRGIITRKPQAWSRKADPSFRDMLHTLRRASVRQHVLAMAPSGRGSRKLARLLEDAVAMAA
jgi:hypothetical protein